MKAIVLKEYNKLVYEDVPKPTFEDNEILIKVKACGICGSDVHGMDGSTGRRIPPIIMGHEAAGVIERTGANVSKWKPGQRVTFDSTIYSQTDWFTKKGMYNLSDNRKVLGVSTGEYRQEGAFAEYVVVPEHILYELPDNVNFEEAAMVEPVAVAYHAIDLTKISEGDTVLVVGSGIIGLFLIQLLKAKKISKIIAVDTDNKKLAMAKSFGADLALNPKECQLSLDIKSVTDGRGVDVVFEAVGVEETVNMSIDIVRKGGSVTLVGNLSNDISFPLQSVVTRQICIQGSCAINGEYPMVLDMISKGQVDVKSMLSAFVPLSEGVEWFQKLYDKTPGLNKVVLKP